MVVADAAYLVNTIATVLATEASHALGAAILLPSLVGELALALWLVVRGARSSRLSEVDTSRAGPVLAE